MKSNKSLSDDLLLIIIDISFVERELLYRNNTELYKMLKNSKDIISEIKNKLLKSGD